MKRAKVAVFVIVAVVPIVLLNLPFVMWNDTMSLILRIVSSFAFQILMLSIGKHVVVKVIPLLFTGAFAAWGTYLYCTSSTWSKVTLWGLLTDYVSPFICCSIVFCIGFLRKERKNFNL